MIYTRWHFHAYGRTDLIYISVVYLRGGWTRRVQVSVLEGKAVEVFS
jgi:hypothetical protein